MEEHLIDQITEKCKSKDLRRKILSVGDNITLNDIIFEANALESVNRQMQEFENTDKSAPSTSGINIMHTKKINTLKILKNKVALDVAIGDTIYRIEGVRQEI